MGDDAEQNAPSGAATAACGRADGSASDSASLRPCDAPAHDAPAPDAAVARAAADACDDASAGPPPRRRRRRRRAGPGVSDHARAREGGAGQVRTDEARADTAGADRAGADRAGADRAGADEARMASGRSRARLFGALDLGTNNCRLLIATPTAEGFRAVDAFSRIVRLGEGLAANGSLTPEAMDRAVDALSVCAAKLRRRRVTQLRCVATQACRGAANGADFVGRVAAETGIALEVISPHEEARLAVMGCLALIDREADAALVVDIGGGSTELSWVDVAALRRMNGSRWSRPPIVAWASAPIGVVSLAERFPEPADRVQWYDDMLAYVRPRVPRPEGALALAPRFHDGRAHLVGASGAVTSLAGVHLGLPRYERSKVDGLWVTAGEALAASRVLQSMDQKARAAQPCIGPERADLVVAGCAILEAIIQVWPTDRLRVADRGLREGMLMTLMHRPRRRRRRRRGASA